MMRMQVAPRADCVTAGEKLAPGAYFVTLAQWYIQRMVYRFIAQCFSIRLTRFVIDG
jgi:hypothetical protein